MKISVCRLFVLLLINSILHSLPHLLPNPLSISLRLLGAGNECGSRIGGFHEL